MVLEDKKEIIKTLEKIRSKAFKAGHKVISTITTVALDILQDRTVAHANLMLHTEEIKEYIKDDDETEE